MNIENKLGRCASGGIAAALVAILAAGCGADAEAAGAEEPSVDPTHVAVEQGELQGVASEGVRRWLGVPYATPPVEELRWAPPQEPGSWDGVRDAAEFGASCAQGVANMPAVPSESEDCLYLNVYAPDGDGEALPVMVWFHGGGNSYGAGSQYDPSRLVVDGEVVVVTVNYRLGLFANMSHPSLDADAGQILSGDYGLQDQQAALEWTKSNAAGFGGDPGNVTVFGESGGGYDVCAHLTSPSSAGLFDKAVIQSAPCAFDWAPSRAQGQARDVAVAETLGCADLDRAAECLRELETTELIDAGVALQEVQPVIGGPAMPVSTREALEAGTVHEVPVLLGINRDEEQLMVFGRELESGGPIEPDDYPAILEETYGEHAVQVDERYPLEEYDYPAQALAAAQTDELWAAPLAATVELLRERTSTFVYELDVADAPWFAGLDEPEWTPGAYHMVDVAFLFDVEFFAERDAEHEVLADLMVDRWTRFAHTGAPEAEGPWEPADRDRDVRRLSPDGASSVDFHDEHRVEFWNALDLS